MRKKGPKQWKPAIRKPSGGAQRPRKGAADQALARRRSQSAPKPNATPAVLVEGKLEPDCVDVPSHTVLAIAGEGGPDQPSFESSLGALYGIAYTLKFARKHDSRAGFEVGVLVGDWWAEGADLPLHAVPARETWRWRLQLAVPTDVKPGELQARRHDAFARRAQPTEEVGNRVPKERLLDLMADLREETTTLALDTAQLSSPPSSVSCSVTTDSWSAMSMFSNCARELSSAA